MRHIPCRETAEDTAPSANKQSPPADPACEGRRKNAQRAQSPSRWAAPPFPGSVRRLRSWDERLHAPSAPCADEEVFPGACYAPWLLWSRRAACRTELVRIQRRDAHIRGRWPRRTALNRVENRLSDGSRRHLPELRF